MKCECCGYTVPTLRSHVSEMGTTVKLCFICSQSAAKDTVLLKKSVPNAELIKLNAFGFNLLAEKITGRLS